MTNGGVPMMEQKSASWLPPELLGWTSPPPSDASRIPPPPLRPSAEFRSWPSTSPLFLSLCLPPCP